MGCRLSSPAAAAFTVAVGIIGLMTAKEGQTDVDNMEGYRMIAELTDFMLSFYGTLHCVELQKLEIMGYEKPLPRHCGGAGQKAGGTVGEPQDLLPGKRRTTELLMCRKARDYMKDFSQYGNRPDDQWEMLPWIPDPRPPFQNLGEAGADRAILPHFHHPYAISLLLKINDGFRTENSVGWD